MIGTYARLKLAILANAFRASSQSRIGSLLVASGAIVGGLSYARGFERATKAVIAAGAGGAGQAGGNSLVVGFTVIAVFWVFGPLFLGGIDDTLDPKRLSLLPLGPFERVKVAAVGGLLSYVGLANLLALGGIGAGLRGGSLGVVLLVGLACVVEVLLCLSLSRLVAAGLNLATASRRGRDAGIFLVSTSAAGLWFLSQALPLLSQSAQRTMLRVLRILPPGVLASAVGDAIAGRWLGWLAKMVGATLLLCGVVVSWLRLSERQSVAAVSAPGRRHTLRSSGRLVGVLGGLSKIVGGGRDAKVVLWKESRYLTRSPARRSALVVACVLGLPLVTLQVMQVGLRRPEVVLLAPIAAVFGFGAVNNMLGNDGPALWMELTAGVSMRAMLVGRAIATLPFLVFPTVLAAIVASILARSAEWLPEVLALTCLGWGIPVGIGTYLSVVAPMSHREDALPFSNGGADSGSTGLVMIVALLGVVASAALESPILAALVWAHHLGAWHFLLACPLIFAFGALAWRVGLNRAVRRVRRLGVSSLTDLGTNGAR